MIESKLIIREASAEDIPVIVNLYKSLETGAYNDSDGFDYMATFWKMKQHPYHKLFVAVINEMIIGTFTLTILEYIIHDNKSAGILDAVVVDEHYRSRGIGKQMVEYALRQCKINNCYKMALSSNIARERAHVFYERLGFKIHGYSFDMNLTDDSNEHQGVTNDSI